MGRRSQLFKCADTGRKSVDVYPSAGYSAHNPSPNFSREEEEDEFVRKFLVGLEKIFSDANNGIRQKGSMLQLKTGSSTGITKPAFLDMIEFSEEDIEEKTGKKIKFPIDKKGAAILLLHNAGEFMAWPENPAAFAILFEEAGLNWTLSSNIMGYDNVNYGLWYDDTDHLRGSQNDLAPLPWGSGL